MILFFLFCFYGWQMNFTLHVIHMCTCARKHKSEMNLVPFKNIGYQSIDSCFWFIVVLVDKISKYGRTLVTKRCICRSFETINELKASTFFNSTINTDLCPDNKGQRSLQNKRIIIRRHGKLLLPYRPAVSGARACAHTHTHTAS